MIGHGPDAANDALFQHSLHSPHHFFGRGAQLPGDLFVGPGYQRQPILGRHQDAAVQFVQASLCLRGNDQTSNLSPTKYSSFLGRLKTGYPVAFSISARTSSIRWGVSVANTNHMLKA